MLKNILCSVGLVAMVGTTVNCSDGGPARREISFEALQYSTVDASLIEGGSGSLDRQPDFTAMTANIVGLDAGSSYTVWFIVFNEPTNCTEGAGPAGCGVPDAGIDRFSIESGVGFCDGVIPGADGTAAVDCTVQKDDPSVFLYGSLKNPESAEVHIVLRTHGPTLTGELADAQTTTYNGGCEAGEPNEGLCTDSYFLPFVGTEVILEGGDGGHG